MTLAALSGLKIALGPGVPGHGPAQAGREELGDGRPRRDVPGQGRGLSPRYRPMLLIPHTLAGAWVAHESMKADGVDDPSAAALGAVVAAGVATVAPMVRIAGSKILGIPDPLLGLAEDYLALRMGNEAMGLTMDDVTEAAKGSIGEVREMVMPALQSAGIGAYTAPAPRKAAYLAAAFRRYSIRSRLDLDARADFQILGERVPPTVTGVRKP